MASRQRQRWTRTQNPHSRRTRWTSRRRRSLPTTRQTTASCRTPPTIPRLRLAPAPTAVNGLMSPRTRAHRSPRARKLNRTQVISDRLLSYTEFTCKRFIDYTFKHRESSSVGAVVKGELYLPSIYKLHNYIHFLSVLSGMTLERFFLLLILRFLLSIDFLCVFRSFHFKHIDFTD